MKKIYFLVACIWCYTHLLAHAQYQTVVYDYERNYFNQGQPLPAETNFILSGQVPKDVDYVEVEVYKGGKHKKPQYISAWKRSYTNKSETFEIPVNYKLRGEAEYDFELNSYRKATDTEKENLKRILNSSLDAYVDGVISVERRRLSVGKAPGAMVEDLNDIVNSGTQLYKSKINFNFPGFSGIVKNKIKQLKDARLRQGLFNFSKSEASNRREAKRLYADKLISELKTALHTEIEQGANTELLVLSDNKTIKDYETEETSNVISINAGYGGVYFSGDLKDLQYDSAPYVGISFPFTRSTLASPFWRNTSISVGAFLNNLTQKDANGNDITVTGPIFGRPVYAALGYRAFKFIRINAGVTALENKKPDGSGVFDVELKDIKVKPFVGISAEINLWMGLGDKRP